MGVYRSAQVYGPKLLALRGGGEVRGCQFSEKNKLHNT